MSEVEYGIIHQSDTEPHRENMTEATARAWIAEFEEDGGKAGAFRVIRRTIGPWELVDESPAGGAVSTVAGTTADHRGAGGATPGAPSTHDIEQHAGYFCATHGFVLIDFCSCPDDDVVSLWTNQRDDAQFVRVLNRHRDSSAKVPPMIDDAYPDGMSTRDVIVEYLTRGRIVLREDAQLLIDAAIREGISAGDPPLRQRRFSELIRDAERRRIWLVIQGWTEIAHRLDDAGELVAIEGAEFRPLKPFFDELHAMVFPDEYLTDNEVRGSSTRGGREGSAPTSWAEYAAGVAYCSDCDGMGCETCGGLGESDPGSGAGYQSQGQEAGGVPPRPQSEGILTTPPAGVLDVEDTCTGEPSEDETDG